METVTEPAPKIAASPIVVAVNAVRRCGQTLELASALAAHTGADLDVVFVEDANLLRLADLPVTREIDRISGMTRDLDSRRVLRALHCEAQQLRREVSRLNKAASVRSTVRVVRGHYFTEALAASANVDVTFVHGAGQPFLGNHPPSRGPRHAALGVKREALGGGGKRPPFWALFDGSPASARALNLAAKLAHRSAANLVVLMPGQAADEIEERKREARQVADTAELQYLAVAGDGLSQLGGTLTPRAGSVLVLARKSPALEDGRTPGYLESLTVPMVLVA